MSATTELGAGGFIYREYKGVFKVNGIDDYGVLEDSVVECLLKASQIKRVQKRHFVSYLGISAKTIKMLSIYLDMIN